MRRLSNRALSFNAETQRRKAKKFLFSLCFFAFALTLLTTAGGVFAEEQLLLNATFDDADLHGWKIAGDLCVAPAFCGGEPFGKYWLALSTNNDEDPITMCGSNSVAGLQTVLRSPNLAFRGKPSRIRVDFKIKFLTNENTDTDLGNDSLSVTVLTSAGPIVIAAFDDSGASPGSTNLTIGGDPSFRESRCSPTWKYETGVLQVSYYRSFRDPFRSLMAAGPIAIEFLLNNRFDTDFDSAVILDDIQLRVE
jgi:hypothetical protein